MPEGAVYVGRPTIWGNPFKAPPMSRGAAVTQFRKLVGKPLDVRTIQGELRGKDLACWCPLDQPCHADVLLEIANAEAIA
jgi:hypothetical protein